MLKSRRFFATLFATALLGVGFASPASAQQTGLVNVEISNVANNNVVTIQVPINAAANICGVDVTVVAAVLGAAGVQDFDTTTCRATGKQRNVTSITG
jgi:hypothetical protein